ncbi:MAG: ExbD/TolR family protein [Planctomycetota bacterium]
MLIHRSFVDVLFILLLGTLVMLTQAVQLGSIDTALATLGSGDISPVRADEVRVVAIGEDVLLMEGQPSPTIEALVARLRPDDAVLLVTADADVRHHRVLEVWSGLRKHVQDVKLGAKPVPDEPAPAEGG